jgi:cytochrome c oxidase subunit 2
MEPAADRLAGSALPLQDALLPAGPQAAHILDLWRLGLGICALVFVLLAAALAWSLWRAPRAAPGSGVDLSSLHRPEPGPRRGVSAAITASTLLLLFLIVASVMTDRALARLSLAGAIDVQVTASQWWWQLRYDDPVPSRSFTTANELHVPVGRPVVLTLKSSDVIHSFWAPSLHGKKDLIPGRTAQLQFRVDTPGVYRGQCAEFCGTQHSWMAFDVVAEPAADYEAWAARQREAATEPADAVQRRGRELFTRGTCVMCHAVQGTAAGAQRGPDLTHVAQRRSLGAGTLPNTPAQLKRWIRDPQAFKPGALMPASNLADDELDAVVAYLGSLR